MSALEVPAQETGVIRLFSIALPPEEIPAFAEPHGDGTWPLKRALGAERLDPEQIEVFPVGDVAALGLAAYLTEGLGMPEEEVDAERERIDAVRGHVLVVHSAAFGGTAERLEPKPPLHLVGTYHETPVRPVIGPVADSEAAKGGRRARRTPPVKHARRSPLRAGLIVIAAILLGAAIVVMLAVSLG